MRYQFVRKLWPVAAITVFAIAGFAWWQRTPVLTWYYLRGLAEADGDNRAIWVDRVVSLDRVAVPGLLDLLERNDPTICDNVEYTLSALVKQWGPEDDRSTALADDCRGRFTGMSALGQISALQVIATLLRQEGPGTLSEALTRSAGDLLQECRERPELRGAALVLACALIDRVPSGQWLDTCRALAEQGLGDRLWRSRLAAVQLVMRAPLQGDRALLAKVVPLLHDVQAELRRAAVVALASARGVLSEDDMLPLLHDADLEVQHLCEAALRSRGLTDAHLELGRLISDPHPPARLQVLERLGRTRDLDPAAWLRRLCQDPSSAVRAAAVRAALRYPETNLGDRLREMAQQDPSETVRQNAMFYLQEAH
jgi:HEAT repeat protein